MVGYSKKRSRLLSRLRPTPESTLVRTAPRIPRTDQALRPCRLPHRRHTSRRDSSDSDQHLRVPVSAQSHVDASAPRVDLYTRDVDSTNSQAVLVDSERARPSQAAPDPTSTAARRARRAVRVAGLFPERPKAFDSRCFSRYYIVTTTHRTMRPTRSARLSRSTGEFAPSFVGHSLHAESATGRSTLAHFVRSGPCRRSDCPRRGYFRPQEGGD